MTQEGPLNRGKMRWYKGKTGLFKNTPTQWTSKRAKGPTKSSGHDSPTPNSLLALNNDDSRVPDQQIKKKLQWTLIRHPFCQARIPDGEVQNHSDPNRVRLSTILASQTRMPTTKTRWRKNFIARSVTSTLR